MQIFSLGLWRAVSFLCRFFRRRFGSIYEISLHVPQAKASGKSLRLFSRGNARSGAKKGLRSSSFGVGDRKFVELGDGVSCIC